MLADLKYITKRITVQYTLHLCQAVFETYFHPFDYVFVHSKQQYLPWNKQTPIVYKCLKIQLQILAQHSIKQKCEV